MSLGLLIPSSNCVVNLAPDKKAVLQEAYRVLKVTPGPAPVAGAERGWGGLLLGCHWDAANGVHQGGDVGQGQGRAPLQRVPEQGSTWGCWVLPALLSHCFLVSPFTPHCLPARGRDVLQRRLCQPAPERDRPEAQGAVGCVGLRDGGGMGWGDRTFASITHVRGLMPAECLAGALYWRDLYSIAEEVGFSPPCLVTATPITVGNKELESIIGEGPTREHRLGAATGSCAGIPGSAGFQPGC